MYGGVFTQTKITTKLDLWRNQLNFPLPEIFSTTYLIIRLFIIYSFLIISVMFNFVWASFAPTFLTTTKWVRPKLQPITLNFRDIKIWNLDPIALIDLCRIL